MPVETGAQASIETQGSVYLGSIYDNVNPDSRINPGNQTQTFKKQRQALETRLTLSDRFDTQQQWRWLFKGYAAKARYRDSDGVLHDEARADELFVDWKGDAWFASLGKRRINWGHAQGFNPVNVVVPPRDPANPSRETEGQPMLWISRSSGAQAIDLIAARNKPRGQPGAGDLNRWGLKWSIAAAKSDYALYYFDGAPYRDGRAYERMLGGSFSVDVFPGITAYMEAARFANNYRNYYTATGSSVANGGAYWQSVAGTSVSLGGKRRIIAEYFSNGQGYSKRQRLDYFRAVDGQLAGAAANLITRDFRLTGMNRDYLLINYQDEWRERFTVDISALAAQDRSTALRAQGSYALSDYYELKIVLLRNQGGRDTEFGNSPLSNTLEIWFGASF
ncbi:MAG: hypothetical protein HY066_11085 [Betaproteobacteria bacterium]|nr:hypothetical protein [Betaproteobacteria bacterium]